MTRFVTALGTCLVLGTAGALCAQDSAAPPPHLSVVDGQVFIDRESGREPAEANTPLVVGDRIRAEAGRAEILLGDGSALHLDEQTTIDVNGDNVVRLLVGRLVVFAEGSAGALQVDSAPGSVRIDGSGEVRISLLNDGQRDGLEVAVVRGLANIVTDSATTPVQAGQEVVLYDGDWPSAPVAFNSARADAFYLWSQGLLDSRRGTTSAAYLPSDLNVYASSFDQDGSWSYQAPYGYVWYPTVAATWRPYHHGRWRYYGGFGWTFIGHGRWAYPTHHYGRWGLSPIGRWYWIPSLGWSAAWVNWAVAPGYVGWCPLGWNNRPVLGFWGHRGYYRGYNPARAWTVMTASSFRRGGIGGGRFDPRVFRGASAPSFVVQQTQPRIAVPRGSVVSPNARIAGGTAVPRGSFTRGYPYSGSVASGFGPRSRPSAAPQASSSATYRPGIARPPAATSPAVTAPPAYSARTYSNRGVSTPRGRGQRTPGSTAPPVIYHRGTPVPPDARSNPANAYERAGVAVPRNLPGSVGSSRSVMPRAEPGRGTTPPPQYRVPSAPYQGYGPPSPRSGGSRMTSPGVAPRSGAPYAVPRSSGSYSGPGGISVPSPRGMGSMRQMSPPAGMTAPPAGTAPPARTAPSSAAPSHAVPRGGHSRR
jgi:Family of unknown function (DUF6600)/FecR protein